MAMPLEYSGVMLVAAVMPLLLGALAAIYWRSRRAYHGFTFWVLANFGIGIGYVLMALRGRVPPLVSVVAANVLAVYSIALIYEGVEAFFDRPLFNLFNHLAVAAFVLFQSYFTYLHPDSTERIFLVSIALGVLHARVAQALLMHPPAALRRTCRTIGLVFAVAGLASFLRAAYAATRTVPLDLTADPTLAATTFVSACAITIWTFYFLFLNSARVELELEDAGQRLADSAVASRREVAQLALLEETSHLIAGSLDESEILRRTVQALVSQFGYVEAAISMLVEDDQLEVAAIGGTDHMGFDTGYRQRIGEGIIGHAAETGQMHVTGDIESDPYYYTIGHRSGSAAGVPLLNDGDLYGVLYVESAARDAFTHTDAQMLHALAGHVVTAVNKARLHAATQDHLVVMTTLHRISQIITSSLELDRIFQTVLQLLKDSFGYTHISIYLLEQDYLKLGAEIGYPQETVLYQIPVTQGVIGRSVQTKQVQFVRDASQEPAFLRAARDVNSEICVPLFRNMDVIGVINVEGAHGSPLTEHDVDVLTALAGPVSIAIDNAHLHADAKALARTDGLTPLMNRRTFDQTLEAEIARAARYDCPLTLMILDIDDFKATNDRWGHQAGDALLRATARMITSNIRVTDNAARYGGDEFAIILPNTPLADGMELGERLRLAARKLGSNADDSGIPPGGYSLSLGVASYPGNARSAEELLRAADHAELAAKQLGKDRLCAAEPLQS